MNERPASIEAVLPLSAVQEGMLFHAVERVEKGRDIVQVYGQLEQSVTATALRDTLQAAIDRHSILRTGFVWKGTAKPLQVVKSEATLPYTISDCSGLTQNAAARRRDLRLAARRRSGFDLSRPPLIALDIINMPDSSPTAIITFHHIVLDGWSFAALLSEITEDAVAHSRHKPLIARRKRVDFRAFFAWLGDQDPMAGKAFWRDMLEGAEAQKALGLSERDPDARPDYRKIAIALNQAEMEELKAAVARMGVTPATIASAAWALVMLRRSDSGKALFGITVSGRPPDLQGSEEILGMLIATLPVFENPGPDVSVAVWLRGYQSRSARARTHAHVPLPVIAQAAGLDRAALDFESVFVFENFPEASVAVGSALLTGPVETQEQTGYPATLTAMQVGDSLRIELEYNATRLEPHIAQTLLDQFRTAISVLSTSDNALVRSLDPMPQLEQDNLLALSRGLRLPLAPLSLRERIVEAAAIGDRVAVQTASEQISYCDLLARADTLAAALNAAGVGLDRPVGVFVERGVAHAIAATGILFAGAAYVPIDTSWPLDRVRAAARAADIAGLIIAPDGPEYPEGPWEVFQTSGICTAEPKAGATDDPLAVAYIAFTSGTTSTPKLAMIERRGLSNHLEMMIDFLQLGPKDVVAQTASVSFDIAVWQLLAPLAVGARVAVVDEVTGHEPTLMHSALETFGVTILQTVPSIIEPMIQASPPARLRCLCSTGDPLPSALAVGVLARWPDVRLLNAYGPAETADDATLIEIKGKLLHYGATAPIGRAARNLTAFVLDSDMRLTAAGLPGTLWIGGEGVGRGYANDPRRTADVYRPDPFATQPGARLYNSGDRALRLVDGNLQFLGRGDRQIKLNGARIELAEVEAAISRHPDVKQALACVVGTGDAQKLVAWAITPTPAEKLRRALQDWLPRFAVPSVIQTLDAFPLTDNGKVDRKTLIQCLPTPDPTPPHSRVSVSMTPQEEAMAAIFALVLNRERVGVEDDFFALGGHSLLAIRLIARARTAFDSNVSIAALFDDPTPRRFAARVAQARTADHDPMIQPVPGIAGDMAPATAGQLRLWHTITAHPGIALFNLPVALRILGDLDPALLEESLNDLIQRQDMLATRFIVENDSLFQLRMPDFAPRLPMIDLSGAPDQDQRTAALAQQDAAWPFNPFEEPLFRAALIRLDPRTHVLLLTTNHLVADDQSLGLIMEDLFNSYSARCVDSDPLAPLPLRFGDLALWKAETSTSKSEAKEYWRAQLADLSPRIDLPSIAARGSTPGSRFRRIRRELPSALVIDLEAMARSQGMTLFVLAASAFGAMLGLRSNTLDVRFATLMSIRDQPELLELVAPMIETVILRAPINREKSAARYLQTVQRALVGAMRHGHLPIEEVVAVAAPDRDLLTQPLCQALLIFQRPLTPGDDLAGALDGTGLTLSNFATSSAQAPCGTDEFEVTTFEIICEVEATTSGIAIVMRYDADIFDASLAKSMCDDIQNALEAIINGPETPVGQLLDQTD